MLLTSCSLVIFMRMVTCVDLSYTTYRRTELSGKVSLERKVEKVKHMKLEAMWAKTKNNMNFQSK